MRERPFLSLLLACSLSIAGVGTGCFSGVDLPSSVPDAGRIARDSNGRPPLPMPSKDEVALVDGRPLTLTDYLALRDHIRKHTTEAVLWAGIAALAIQNETRARGAELRSASAVEVALYALGELNAAEADNSLRAYFARTGLPPKPDEVRAALDRLLATSIVRRNERALSSLGQL